MLDPRLASVSSRVDLGAASRRLGLFLTADDTALAPELRELRQLKGEVPACAAPAHAVATLDGVEERP